MQVVRSLFGFVLPAVSLLRPEPPFPNAPGRARPNRCRIGPFSKQYSGLLLLTENLLPRSYVNNGRAVVIVDLSSLISNKCLPERAQSACGSRGIRDRRGMIRIVNGGAQQLLSEEFGSQIQVGEQKNEYEIARSAFCLRLRRNITHHGKDAAEA
jgi:hypothetical protein